MPMQHISKLSADDFKAVVGQSFQVSSEGSPRTWILRDVEAHTMTLAGECLTCGEGEKIPTKKKLTKKEIDKLAKAAVVEVNANLEAIGYTGPKLTGPVNMVTLGFDGEEGKDPLPDGEYSLFNEGLGTIEGVFVSPTVKGTPGVAAHPDAAPLYDVTYTLA